MSLFATSMDDPAYGRNMAIFRGIANGDVAGELGLFQKALQERKLFELKLAETRAAMEDKQRQRDFLQNLPGPEMMAAQSALSAGGGPTNENAARVPAVPPALQLLHRGVQAGSVPFGDYLKSFQPQERINKLDAKDFTPESVQKFNRSGNYADLVRMDKLHFADGGGYLAGLNPFTGERVGVPLQKTQTPDNAATVAATMRGQNMTDARSRELNAITREANASQIVNDPLTGPLIINKGTGTARPATGLDGKPIAGEKAVAAKQGAADVLQLLDQAEKIIPSATGSYAGTALDEAARVVGAGTSGAKATAQLKALEGAIMAKMPRMEGPQSNLDVQLYRQSAGQIGDPTVPNSIKQAAIRTIREIQARNAGMPAKQPAKPGTLGSGTWSIQKVE